jgi:hypothetical protein
MLAATFIWFSVARLTVVLLALGVIARGAADEERVGRNRDPIPHTRAASDSSERRILRLLEGDQFEVERSRETPPIR